MSNGAIGWVDYCSADTDGEAELDEVTASSVAFDPAYPARNCLTPDVSRVTRVDYDTGLSAAEFSLRFYFSASSDDTQIRILAALNLRLPPDIVDISVRVLDSGGTYLETGTAFTAAQLSLIPGTTDRYDLFWILSQEHMCNSVQFRFRLSGAIEEGYVEIGRAWAGPAVVFDGGVGYVWSLSGVDPSRIYRSEGGGYAAFQYPTRKVLTVNQGGMTYQQTLGGSGVENLRNLFLGAGTSSPVVLISDDTDQHIAQVGSVYGLISSFPSLDHEGVRKYSTSLRIEQLR